MPNIQAISTGIARYFLILIAFSLDRTDSEHLRTELPASPQYLRLRIFHRETHLGHEGVYQNYLHDFRIHR